MRLIFGVLSLLVVLAIVGSLAKKQLQAINGGVTTRMSTAASQARAEQGPSGSRDGATLAIAGGMPGATPADTSGLTVPQQARNIQQQFRDDATRALQQGADRNARAAP
ncbi:MAG: hypothetical protein ABI809_10180 [Caldimonas sp.]